MEKLALLIYHGTRNPDCRLLLDRIIRRLGGELEGLKVDAADLKSLPSKLQSLPSEGLEVHAYILLLTPGSHYERDVAPHIYAASKRVKMIVHGLIPEWLVAEALQRTLMRKPSKPTTVAILSRPSPKVEERMRRIELEASKRLNFKVKVVACTLPGECKADALVTVCPSTLAERMAGQVKSVVLLEEAEDLLVKWVAEEIRKRY